MVPSVNINEDASQNVPELIAFDLKSPADMQKLIQSLVFRCPTNMTHHVLVFVLSIFCIINALLYTGRVLELFKEVVVTPRFKTSSVDFRELINYRPVFSINFMGRLLEKVVMDQLHNHLSQA